jgi:methionyl-tRNA synthetase
MLTGMDEHGVKIQQAAALSGMNPKQKVDNEALKFKELFDTAGIAYSRFIRTTDADHAANVQDIWRTLMDNGYIYKGKHSGWYCVQDECFYGEQEVHDIMNSFGFQKVAKESGRSVEWIQEDNYMFALSGFKERIKQWLNSNPDLIYPKERRADVFRLLDSDSFGDVSVSRPKARQFWGIPVPHDENHTVYVWFDALLNYLTASTALSKDGHLSMNHVIGKDILRFHTILWPAVLMAADIPLPERIIIHSHWTVNNMKMSKSIGNVFHPDALIRKYGQDAVRYFIARDAGLKEDSDYSEDLLRMRYQVELADRLGKTR